MSIPLFQMKFEDGTEFNGGNLDSTLWRESPDKPIKSLRLRLPTGDFLFMGGYEEYNFFIEATQGIYGDTQKRLHFIYVMGLLNDEVTSYKISIMDYGQYKIGDTIVRKFPKGKEYNWKPTSGWHKGLIKEIS